VWRFAFCVFRDSISISLAAAGNLFRGKGSSSARLASTRRFFIGRRNQAMRNPDPEHGSAVSA
jgi:hypothetical protein